MGYVKDELMYNYSGYYDPTAGIALRNIARVQPSGYVSCKQHARRPFTGRAIHLEA